MSRSSVPKAFRGYGCPSIFDVELNDVDLEQVLPALFFRVRSRGGDFRASKGEDTLEPYLDAMVANDELLVGFGDEAKRTALEAWLRTAVVKLGTRGRRHEGEKIQFVRPLHYLTSKALFRSTAYRRLHQFLYNVLLRRVADQGVFSKEAYLHDLFARAFGQGVEYGPGPSFDGHYVGHDRLDAEQVLCLVLLEHVPPAHTRPSRKRPEPASLPWLTEQMADDLLLFLETYGGQLPAKALVAQFLALLSLYLNTYTRTLLKLAPEALERSTWPTDTARPDPIYCDFVGQSEHLSNRMARECVDRDLSAVHKLVELFFSVRVLERFAHRHARQVEALRDQGQPQYLSALLALRERADLDLWASYALEEISGEGEVSGEVEEQSSFQQLVQYLNAEQGAKARTNAVRWLRDVSGMNREFGCLVGNARGPRRWYYTLQRTALSAVVHLACVACKHRWTPKVQPAPEPVRLLDLVEFLRERFGMLVADVPYWLDSTRARAAAAENFEVFKQRLRQMGFFTDLSDDFTAQFVTVPGATSPTLQRAAGISSSNVPQEL